MNNQLTPVYQIEATVIPQSEDEADQVASVLLEATRDIGLLRADIAAIRDLTTGIQAELALLANKADVQRARSDLQARIERLQKWLQIGFGVLAGLLAGLVIAALRYLPPLQHG